MISLYDNLIFCLKKSNYTEFSEILSFTLRKQNKYLILSCLLKKCSVEPIFWPVVHKPLPAFVNIIKDVLTVGWSRHFGFDRQLLLEKETLISKPVALRLATPPCKIPLAADKRIPIKQKEYGFIYNKHNFSISVITSTESSP